MGSNPADKDIKAAEKELANRRKNHRKDVKRTGTTSGLDVTAAKCADVEKMKRNR